MSKLAELIELTATGNHRAVRDMKLNYLAANLHVNSSVSTHYDKEVLFEVKLRSHQYLDYSLPEDILNLTIRDIKGAMIYEVFGEFKPLLIELRAAVYNEDRSKVSVLLAELDNKMFNLGP